MGADFKLSVRTKNNSAPRDKRRVYFTCHPDDFDSFFDRICNDIFRTHDCAVYYTKDMTAECDENALFDLGHMNLFVIPVTSNLLTQPNRAMDVDFKFAEENRIPVLPVMTDIRLIDLYTEKFGPIQFIDPNINVKGSDSYDDTAIGYREKLKKFLDTVLFDDETVQRIRSAFDCYIFLSYRKMDRRYANSLMRRIHDNPVCRDIAIWYDEFLVPGEDFNDSIRKAMKKSRLFTLLVTPNLLTENNYVKDVEYKKAREEEMPILPVEMKETDKDKLKEEFQGLPETVDSKDKVALEKRLFELIPEYANKENDTDSHHNYLMGLAYLDGIDVEKNIDRAVEMITSAADAGLSAAINKLAFMYYYGQGLVQDYEKARQLWTILADQGDAGAQYTLGLMYDEGYGVQRDMQRAVEWYTKAADQGDPVAQYRLFKIYNYGLGVEEDDEKALEMLIKAAESGNAYAQCGMGRYCLVKEDADIDEALSWFSKSAAQGYDGAFYEMGEIFEKRGQYKKAFDHYLRAYEQNGRICASQVARMYEQGLGVEKDCVEAARYYEMDAREGSMTSAYRLAQMYEIGTGVRKDYKKACFWYEKSGDPDSYYAIGRIYELGLAGDKNIEKAVENYENAVGFGNVEAKYILGMMYMKGRGVKKSCYKGLELLQSAAENCNVAAMLELEILKVDGNKIRKKDAIQIIESTDPGDSESLFVSGALYESGFGVKSNYEKARDYYEAAMILGSKDARNALGYLYEYGKGVLADAAKAAEYFNQSALSGDVKAQRHIIRFYDHWPNGCLDYDKVLSLYKISADKGDPAAMCDLIEKQELCVYSPDQDAPRIIELYTKPAMAGYIKAQIILADAYASNSAARDYKKAFEWYKKAADQGNARAQCELGEMYNKGLGVKQNPKSAFEYYRKAAGQDEEYSLYELGVFYEEGICVETDVEKAFEYYLKSAEFNWSFAQFKVGKFYEYGKGVKQDYQQAAQWFMKSAQQDNPFAQLELAYMYESGDGLEKDPDKVLYWYQKAAKSGNPHVLYTLGMAYLSGAGTKEDWKNAYKLITRAAESGYLPAQFKLGCMYEKGEGITENHRLAMEWFEKAANQGDFRSKDRLRQLMRRSSNISEV